MLGAPAEVRFGCTFNALDARSQIDLIEVRAEDLVVGVTDADSFLKKKFAELIGEIPRWRNVVREVQLCELHGKHIDVLAVRRFCG